MPTHDIIDNRKEKLVDHINRILSSTESARFAVGYFFLSGLESIAQRLAGVKELRLLIGNTTNRETLEQLAEGYRRLELVAEAAEAEAYPKRTETKRMACETAGNTLSLSHGQNYVLRESRLLFGATEDEDRKANINVLERAFRGPITRAVNREVVLLRRNGVSGEALFKALARIYDQHNLRDWVDRRTLHATSRPIPKIVCSEALV